MQRLADGLTADTRCCASGWRGCRTRFRPTTGSRTHEFELDDLADAWTRDRLKGAFSDPDRLRPGETRQSLTERVAASFAAVAQALRARGHDRERPRPMHANRHGAGRRPTPARGDETT